MTTISHKPNYPESRLTVVWSPKGGTGVTTTTALIALRATRQAVVTSFDTDLACVLGQNPDTPNGLANWLNNRSTDQAGWPLSQNGIGISSWVRFLPPGKRAGPDTMPDADAIIAGLKGCGIDLILDCGGLPLSTIKQLAAVADRSLLVVRACYLTLRRCAASDIRATGVILVKEQGRALRTSDVAAALGQGVVAEVPFCPDIARATDAGLLQARHTRALPGLDFKGIC